MLAERNGLNMPQKRFRFWPAIAAALVCATVSGARAQDANAIITALRADQFARALQLAEQRLKATPRDAQTLTLEGLALRGLGRSQEALAAFRRALKIDPDYLAALEGAAQIEYASGGAGATPLLDHLLQLRPDEPTAHAMRAVMAWKQKDCATAVAHFERAAPVIASQPDAHREYGVCLVRLGRPSAAVQIFQQLLAADVASHPARYALASAECSAGQFQPALDSLKPLLEGAAPDAEALSIASAAYEGLGDTPHAVAALRQAIILSPRTVRYYLDFANLSFSHKSFDAGIQMATAGLTLIPDSPQLHLARGILYVQTGLTDRADADFLAAERLDPKQPGAVDVRVLEFLQQNNMNGAVRLVREQIKSSPTNAFLYYLLAEVLNWQGPPVDSPEFKQALEAAKKSVELDPALTLGRNLLSRLYLDSGQVKSAIAECRQVLRSDPSDPVALYRLMRALKASGDPEDAKQIPGVIEKFNEARRLATEKEEQESRYRLVEGSTAGK
jgi:tetratricopeptide (TPR) repeat protein